MGTVARSETSLVPTFFFFRDIPFTWLIVLAYAILLCIH
jgi:hypothetical protein